MIYKIIICILIFVIVLSLLFTSKKNKKEFLDEDEDNTPVLSALSVYDKDCSDCCDLEENKIKENCIENCQSNGNICFCCKK